MHPLGAHIELAAHADLVVVAPASADLLAKVMEQWWTGDEAGARALHTRLLPLINLETHPFMRYILKRRGVFTSLVERAPAGALELDAEDKREISILIDAINDEVEFYPFGAE